MDQHETRQRQPRSTIQSVSWIKILLLGAAYYILALGVLMITGNANLFPSVVMVGSFLVPVTFVAFFYQHRHFSVLTLSTTASTMVYGGLLGVIAASILEPLFIRQLDFLTAFQVGLIEEFAKILGVVVIVRHRGRYSEIDGLILGAAAGMGFAGLESTGYAFSAFLRSQGSLLASVYVTLLRGLLSPLGHGTWTAILAAVLFRESTAESFSVNGRVLGAYVTVVILHGLWDGLPSLLSNFVASGLDVLLAQLTVGAVGLLLLWRRWREGTRLILEQRDASELGESPE
jgi:RsiW-degrading membrane proteinase PrsW (M82 family)